MAPDVQRGGAAADPAPRRFDPGLANLARAQAFLAGGGALVGMLSVLLPHTREVNELGIILVQASSVSLAVWLWFRAGNVPRWVLSVTPLVGTISVSAVVYFSGDSTSAYALFYLWVAIYAFYLLSRFEAALQIGFAIFNYALVVLLVGVPGTAQANDALTHFTIVTGTFLATAIPLLYLRGRVEGLWARLSDAARTDLLTGLCNGQGLRETLTSELERARLSGGEVSTLSVDLDRFKDIERRLGHSAADELLCRVATLLDEATRRIDTVARTGPNQFTVVLPEIPVSEALIIAEQLLARVRRGTREEPAPLTASIGIASYPHDAITVEELLRLGDQALRAAKMLGRDRAVCFSSEVGSILGGAAEGRGNSHVHLATMLSLAEALDLRDSGTADHSEQVGTYAEMIARALGLSEQRVERVRLAGLLHDIGKVGIPDDILRKAGPLDDDEWEQIGRHPEIAARILGTRELVDIREWILTHHERPDGKGYPRGLAGTEIPLEGRILAVADAYEAMTADRVYRTGLGHRAALEELRQNAGTQFDPEVVDAFVRVLEQAAKAAS
jgi:diguanylate cyclase (GGDEF)-like protein/putative nucleotidyltransferase with HDIG domain